MQLQTRLQVWRSHSLSNEIPVVNKVGALDQERCWEVGDERKGYQNAVHLTQKVRAIPLCSSLVYQSIATLIFEAKSLKSMPAPCLRSSKFISSVLLLLYDTKP